MITLCMRVVFPVAILAGLVAGWMDVLRDDNDACGLAFSILPQLAIAMHRFYQTEGRALRAGEGPENSESNLITPYPSSFLLRLQSTTRRA